MTVWAYEVQRRLPRALVIAFIFASGLWLGRCGQAAREDAEFQTIYVPRTVLIHTEPDTVVQWREKVVYRTVKPTQVVVADSGATETVEKFCRAAELTDSTSGNATSGPTSSVVPALIRSGSFDGKNLYLFEAVANGDLRRSEFHVRAPFQFAERDSGILVQGSRTWWVDDALKAGGVFLTGYLVGRIR